LKRKEKRLSFFSVFLFGVCGKRRDVGRDRKIGNNLAISIRDGG
jgi:hypothetical protein